MFIAIEVSQSTVRVGCSHLGHEIEALARFKTPSTGSELITSLKLAIQKIASDMPIDGIGVAVHGNLDANNQHIVRLGQKNLPTTFLSQKTLSQAFGCPIVLAQAAQLAGFIEYRYGAAAKTNRMLYVDFSDSISHCHIENTSHLATHQTRTGDLLIPEHNQLIKLDNWLGAIDLEVEFGKSVKNLNSTQISQIIARRMAITIYNLQAIYQPSTTVIGGATLLSSLSLYPLTKKDLRQFGSQTPIKRAIYNQLGSLLGALWLIHQ